MQQCNGPRDRLTATDGAELELVPGEGKRRRAVPVGVVLLDLGQLRDAQLDELFLRARGCGLALDDVLDELREHRAHEDRDDGRRCLVGAKAMLVAGRGNAGAEEPRVLMDALENRSQED